MKSLNFSSSQKSTTHQYFGDTLKKTLRNDGQIIAGGDIWSWTPQDAENNSTVVFCEVVGQIKSLNGYVKHFLYAGRGRHFSEIAYCQDSAMTIVGDAFSTVNSLYGKQHLQAAITKIAQEKKLDAQRYNLDVEGVTWSINTYIYDLKKNQGSMVTYNTINLPKGFFSKEHESFNLLNFLHSDYRSELIDPNTNIPKMEALKMLASSIMEALFKMEELIITKIKKARKLLKKGKNYFLPHISCNDTEEELESDAEKELESDAEEELESDAEEELKSDAEEEFVSLDVSAVHSLSKDKEEEHEEKD